MSWVLDCSMAIGFALPDEASPIAEAFVADMPDDYTVCVPPLWWYEIANALTVIKRRKRITEPQCGQLMDMFHHLPVRTDIGVGDTTFFRNQHLAATHTLSAYDAAYLELAIRRGLGLATLDDRLRDTAQTIGIPVFTV